jgi:hypothetical protein
MSQRHVARPPRGVSAQTPRRDYTPAVLARLLIAEEVRLQSQRHPTLLSGVAWTSAATVRFRVRDIAPKGSPLGETTWAEVEAIMALLVSRGLVEEAIPEAETRPGRPQLYRWARGTSTATLERYLHPPDPGEGLCDTEHCMRPRAPGSRHCSWAHAQRTAYYRRES